MLTTITFSTLIDTGSSAASTTSRPNEPQTIVVTSTDEGSTIDVLIGTSINVYLKVPASEVYKQACRWSKIITTDDVKLQFQKKFVLLPTGVTGGSFKAVRSGMAQLRSTRYDCSSGVNIDWHVDIRIS